MDTEDQIPEEDALNYLLGRARWFILNLIDFIDTALARLPASPPRQAIAYLTRRALLPAEAALRRAILLIASEMEMPVPRAPRAKPTRPPAPPLRRQAPADRAPIFRMSEPPPRPAKAESIVPKADYLPEHLLPRICILTDDVLGAPPPPPLPAPAARDPGARFFRRLAALRQAYDDPRREARRWLRRNAAPAPRPAPIISEKIPGMRRALGPDAQALLRELTEKALRTLTPNTS
ncbi:MAG: hypothetical protein C0456_02645 [Hyphomonas sp.]|uniref:hypothetical protein n=1 Tax=Hyphomonas sp. TaxID=87 RepID=UPI001D50096A|nr:hypothetical protein [Hyphomonas sp.]MBA4225504.1 hypothetical protein [Hyphomonas sp.]